MGDGEEGGDVRGGAARDAPAAVMTRADGLWRGGAPGAAMLSRHGAREGSVPSIAGSNERRGAVQRPNGWD